MLDGLKRAVSFVSRGSNTNVTKTRHADIETMNHLIRLQNKVCVYEAALLIIYREAEDRFIHNVAATALENQDG
jgi:hypothetical protein